ncbi:MAG TPA: BsuPI-related putative proteinase inhibitor [Gemmatimonadaceae bacterium]|nr:BsuPI-related putative proteinase inhibitor [Gemmatimonadaceae bacterium]
MKVQHVMVMLAGVAIVFACAPRNHTGAERETRKAPPAQRSTDTNSTFAFTRAEQRSGSRSVSFAMEFRNKRSSLTELHFANGRTHEFVVLDDAGREVWRWSEGRLFTQALQTKQLRTGDAVTFQARWDTAAPGRYRVVGSLNSTEVTEPVEREFVVH